MLRPTRSCSAACSACSATSGHKQPTSAENENPRRSPPGVFSSGGWERAGFNRSEVTGAHHLIDACKPLPRHCREACFYCNTLQKIQVPDSTLRDSLIVPRRVAPTLRAGRGIARGQNIATRDRNCGGKWGLRGTHFHGAIGGHDEDCQKPSPRRRGGSGRGSRG